jgi:hypothetical protein
MEMWSEGTGEMEILSGPQGRKAVGKGGASYGRIQCGNASERETGGVLFQFYLFYEIVPSEFNISPKQVSVIFFICRLCRLAG